MTSQMFEEIKRRGITMKKRCVVLLIAILFVFCSCSLPVSSPEDGLWYCDELKMTIDFSYDRGEKCVQVVQEDGSVVYFDMGVDFSGRLEVFYYDEEYNPHIYLIGKIKHRGNTFYWTIDEKTYTFVLQE